LQAENDAKQAREQLREELRKSEAENKSLRDNLRNERDLLEKTMREHSSAVSEALEQRQRIEAAANKREDALTRRCQHAERELDDLRVSSVPETHLRQLRDELKKEKEEVVNALQKAREEAKRSDEHYVSVISRLELRVAEAEGEASQRAARVKVLEQQCRELEAQVGLSCFFSPPNTHGIPSRLMVYRKKTYYII
jgi:chromosome segregation ATPase